MRICVSGDGYGILEKLFLLRRLPAFSRNELSRLLKSPKVHFLDAGLQSTLTRLTPEHVLLERQRFGATLESPSPRMPGFSPTTATTWASKWTSWLSPRCARSLG